MIIYIIKNNLNNFVYIGLTTQTLEERWKEHKRSARSLIKYLSNPTAYKEPPTNQILYYAMSQNLSGFYIQVVHQDSKLSLSDLRLLEIMMIKTHDSMMPNGYNMNEGGTGVGKHTDETKKLMSKNRIKTALTQRHAKLEGCPAHTTYCDKNNIESIRVYNHPLCASKKFEVRKYGTLELVKIAVNAFIMDLEAKGIKYDPKAEKRAKYLKVLQHVNDENCEDAEGFYHWEERSFFEIRIKRGGRIHKKTFGYGGPKMKCKTVDAAKTKAIEYYNQVITMIYQ